MRKKSASNQEGFSLVELMVAIALLTIGTLVISTMLKTSSELAGRSVQNIVGDAIALELVEAVKSQVAVHSFSDISSGTLNLGIQKLAPGSTTIYEYQDSNALPTTGTSTTITTNDTKFVENFGVGRGYVYKWHVENQTNSSWPPNILKLDVTVGWSEGRSQGNPLPTDPNKCLFKTRLTTFILVNTT